MHIPVRFTMFVFFKIDKTLVCTRAQISSPFTFGLNTMLPHFAVKLWHYNRVLHVPVVVMNLIIIVLHHFCIASIGESEIIYISLICRKASNISLPTSLPILSLKIWGEECFVWGGRISTHPTPTIDGIVTALKITPLSSVNTGPLASLTIKICDCNIHTKITSLWATVPGILLSLRGVAVVFDFLIWWGWSRRKWGTKTFNCRDNTVNLQNVKFPSKHKRRSTEFVTCFRQ